MPHGVRYGEREVSPGLVGGVGRAERTCLVQSKTPRVREGERLGGFRDRKVATAACVLSRFQEVRALAGPPVFRHFREPRRPPGSGTDGGLQVGAIRNTFTVQWVVDCEMPIAAWPVLSRPM